jgi:hypothetical protein
MIEYGRLKLVVIHGAFASCMLPLTEALTSWQPYHLRHRESEKSYRLRRICTSHLMGWQVYVETKPRTLYSLDWKVPLFSYFTREGDMDYTGCGNTEHRGHLSQILLEKRCRWACFALWWKACHIQGLSKNAQLQATVNYKLPFVLYILWC